MSAKRRLFSLRTRSVLTVIFGSLVLGVALLSHIPLAQAAVSWNITPSSACTLFDAITANNNSASSGSCSAGDSGTGTINLAAGTYTLSANLPLISHPLNIVGSGVGSTIIDGQNQYKVFLDSNGSLDSVTNLTINHAGNGGSGVGEAIFAEPNTFTMNNVVLENSTVDGGVQLAAYNATVSNVAILNNGGNAYALTAGFTNGTYNITNLTVYGNRNGINANPNGTGTANFTNITSASNTGTGIFFQIGGGSPTVNLENSILDNTTNCAGSAITSQGYNIVSDNSCGFVGTSNHNSTNPSLGSLTLVNGSYVLPIDYNSPAYDAGSSSGAPSTDQVGTTRPQCSGIDIGAYETPTCTPTPPPASGGNSGSSPSSSPSSPTPTKKTSTTTTTSAAPTTTTTTPTTPTPTSTPLATTKQTPTAAATALPVAKHSSSHVGIILAAVGIILVAAGAGGWFWLTKHPALLKKLLRTLHI